MHDFLHQVEIIFRILSFMGIVTLPKLTNLTKDKHVHFSKLENGILRGL